MIIGKNYNKVSFSLRRDSSARSRRELAQNDGMGASLCHPEWASPFVILSEARECEVEESYQSWVFIKRFFGALSKESLLRMTGEDSISLSF